MPRTLGAITWAIVNDPNLGKFHFVRETWPSPTGIIRSTTFPSFQAGGWDLVSEDIDGSVQDWDSTILVKVGEVSQSQTSSLGVSDISFGNVDRAYTDRIRLHGGIGALEVAVWAAYYDKTTLFAPGGPNFTDAVQVFEGIGEREEAGDWVRVSMIPFRDPMTSPFPRRQYSKTFGFDWIPEAGFQVPWGGGLRKLPDGRQARPDTTTPTQTVTVPRDLTQARFPIVDPTGRRTTRTVPDRGSGGSDSSSGGPTRGTPRGGVSR